MSELRKKLFHRFKKNERGVALIEFALVTPFLILLVLGIVEFGWLFNGWITITSAAREGARIAVVKENDEDFDIYVVEAVRNHASTLENVDATIYIFSEKITGTEYDSVKVTATGELEPLVRFFISDTVILSGEATMRLY